MRTAPADFTGPLTVRQLHHRAMHYAMEGKMAADKEQCKALYAQALPWEVQAAQMIEKERENEPTRSILYLSAASIAYDAGDPWEAQRLAAEGLSGWPAAKTAIDLRELLEAIWREIDPQPTESDDLRATIEGLARQFAYPTTTNGVPVLSTGGMSNLEEAFTVLGWDDPHPCPEYACEYPGCNEWGDCGTPTADGYKRCCGEHFREYQR